MMIKNKFSGFTLIELLIVVAIIGVLSAVLVMVINPNKLRGRARDGVRKNDMAIIKGALELYYAENNSYPPAPPGIPFGAAWVPYLRAVPQDPGLGSISGQHSYCYYTSGGGYALCAQVEDPNDAFYNMGDATGVLNNCGFDVTNAYCVSNPF